jgi:polyisoprenyl-phosphate glycosyltransferase
MVTTSLSFIAIKVFFILRCVLCSGGYFFFGGFQVALMRYQGISIVIPVYNEATVLPYTIKVIIEHLKHIKQFEIIIIDDGSYDNTWEVLNGLTERYQFVRAVRFARNFGKEAAIYAGLQNSLGDAAIVIDADMQHPPDLIPKMIEIWRQGRVHIVEAMKVIRQPESALRRMGARIFYGMFTQLGLTLRHSTDYKLLDRIVIDQYLKFPERNRFFRGLTTWMGFKKESVSFIPENRGASFGKSRWSLLKLFNLARSSLLAFTTIPLRIVTWLGGTTLVVSILLGLQTLWNKFNGHAVEGFTTVILIQLFIGSIIMISLGLIGEYLSCVYEEIKGRPIYIVSDYLNKHACQKDATE